MPLSSAWAALLAAAAKHGTAFQGPATWYIELVSDTPTATVEGTPVIYTGYAGRVGITVANLTADGTGTLTSAAAIVFGTPAAGDSDTATYFEVWDAISGGTRIGYEELDAPLYIDDTLPSVQFPIGALVAVFGGEA